MQRKKRCSSVSTSGGLSKSPAVTILSSRMVFVKAQDLIASDIGLRSLNKLKSAHGGLYMGVHYAHSNFYLVLGTTTKPVTTPKGVVVNEDPNASGHHSACLVMTAFYPPFKP
ncbi:TPA: hypothetical protein ACH3X1_003019 [Trebouxia sp. C0004]